MVKAKKTKQPTQDIQNNHHQQWSKSRKASSAMVKAKKTKQPKQDSRLRSPMHEERDLYCH
jgi:hypothetical protein